MRPLTDIIATYRAVFSNRIITQIKLVVNTVKYLYIIALRVDFSIFFTQNTFSVNSYLHLGFELV